MEDMSLDWFKIDQTESEQCPGLPVLGYWRECYDVIAST